MILLLLGLKVLKVLFDLLGVFDSVTALEVLDGCYGRLEGGIGIALGFKGLYKVETILQIIGV